MDAHSYAARAAVEQLIPVEVMGGEARGGAVRRVRPAPPAVLSVNGTPRICRMFAKSRYLVTKVARAVGGSRNQVPLAPPVADRSRGLCPTNESSGTNMGRLGDIHLLYHLSQ